MKLRAGCLLCSTGWVAERKLWLLQIVPPLVLICNRLLNSAGPGPNLWLLLAAGCRPCCPGLLELLRLAVWLGVLPVQLLQQGLQLCIELT